MSRRDFCTYFDKNYLSRGLALHQSLAAHHPDFRLFVLCLDEETHAYLSRRAPEGMVLVRRTELESFDPELAAVRPTRSLVEYYFTLTAPWLRLLFARFADLEVLTYLDSDFFFFGSSEPLFRELGAGSISVVEHRFPPHLRHQEDRGRFNVGWLSFRRDASAFACIEWWRERCIEWCYDRVEPGRFADQKYLDAWPERYQGVVVLQHRGVSVAPWSLYGCRIGPGVTIDGEPLICFHFHGLKHLCGPLYQSGLLGYRVALDQAMRRLIFTPYLERLVRFERELAALRLGDGRARSLRYLAAGTLPELKQRLGKAYTALRVITSGTHLWAR